MRASLWSTNCIIPCAECTLGPKKTGTEWLVYLQRRFSVYVLQRRFSVFVLRIHRLLMQTQDSDSGDTQGDPNLIC